MNPEFIKQQKLKESGFDLGFWYGVNCTKCCNVYPALIVSGVMFDSCHYECLICGKRTVDCSMPWISEELWNDNKFICNEVQLSIFGG